MSWQGITFKFLSTDPADTVNLALQSIPKIIVDSPTDYTPSIVTGIVSLIAGAIPAGIAIWTFKRNASNTKLEREKQERFLISERAEQHRFLKGERATQIASIEKDRNAQLAIAKQNFDMQVLSVNRQGWINSFRDIVADYISISPNVLYLKNEVILMSMRWTKLSTKAENVAIFSDDYFRDNYDKAGIDLKKAVETFGNEHIRTKLLVAKIKMMLNPNEKWCGILMEQFANIESCYKDLDKQDLNLYKNKLDSINKSNEVILITTQNLLKYEWERVKKGV